MKKHITMLAIGLAIMSSGFSQDVPVDLYQQFSAEAEAAQSWEDIAALEAHMPKDSSLWDNYAKNLVRAASRVSSANKISPQWTWNLFAKYDSSGDWENSTTYNAQRWHTYFAEIPFNNETRSKIKSAKNEAEFGKVIADYLSANIYPQRFGDKVDNRARFFGFRSPIADRATELGLDSALPWALTEYRLANTEKDINNAVARVAQALKAKDFNLRRANAWIDSQNTGENPVTFTESEMAFPIAAKSVDFRGHGMTDYEYALATGDLTTALEQAKIAYRSANSSTALDRAIQDIARVLRAKDLNLKRANEFIQAQQTGEAYDLGE